MPSLPSKKFAKKRVPNKFLHLFLLGGCESLKVNQNGEQNDTPKSIFYYIGRLIFYFYITLRV